MKRFLIAAAAIAALGWMGSSAMASDYSGPSGLSLQFVDRGGHGHGGGHRDYGRGGWHGGHGGHHSGFHGGVYHYYPRYHYYPHYHGYHSYYPYYGHRYYGGSYYGSPRVGVYFGW